MTEKKQHGQGHVEFRAPAVKLTADLPGDDEMRRHLDETMQNDGYPGTCAVIRSETEEEKDSP